MKVKCDFCDATENGSKDELIDKGWTRAIISTPIKITITACPLHGKEVAPKVFKELNKFKKGE
jgi:hypothetical protein